MFYYTHFVLVSTTVFELESGAYLFLPFFSPSVPNLKHQICNFKYTRGRVNTPANTMCVTKVISNTVM